MQTGYNHNIRHRGVLFHVQTEDGGQKKPFVVTTLFYEGNVIASRRSDYTKFAGSTSRREIVVAMMQEQHKKMMKDLVEGRIRGVSGVFRKLNISEAPEPKPVDVTRVHSPVEKKKTEEITSPEREAGPHTRTFNAQGASDRSLDELILDFLSDEQKQTK